MTFVFLELIQISGTSTSEMNTQASQDEYEAPVTGSLQDATRTELPYSCQNLTECNINEDDSDDNDVNDLAVKIVDYCTSHNIEDPVEMLRYFQKIMVEGRALGIRDVSRMEEGDTNFIMVDRYNVLETSFEEVKSLQNIRKTLEVQFYGEVSFY